MEDAADAGSVLSIFYLIFLKAFIKRESNRINDFCFYYSCQVEAVRNNTLWFYSENGECQRHINIIYSKLVFNLLKRSCEETFSL